LKSDRVTLVSRRHQELIPSQGAKKMHDPFQTYATMSAYGASPYAAPYYGTLNPLGMPYNVQQTSAINPLAAIHPLAAAALGLSQGNPTAMNPINPLTGIPQAGQQGYGPQQGNSFIPGQGFGFGFVHPHHLHQAAAALAAQGALQNPILAALLTNPLVAAGLQQQFGQQAQSPYPQFGQIGGSPFAQGGSPFGQGGSPFGQNNPMAGIGYPLAPQSWVGQGGQFGGQGYGQNNPLLALLTARPFQGQGYSPWG
jgi:hypothetical protein